MDKEVLTIDDYVNEVQKSLKEKLKLIRNTVDDSLNSALNQENLSIEDLEFISESLDNLSSSAESEINHLCSLIERRQEFIEDDNISMGDDQNVDGDDESLEKEEGLKEYKLNKAKEVSIENNLSKKQRKELLGKISNCTSKTEVDGKIKEFIKVDPVEEDFKEEYGKWN